VNDRKVATVGVKSSVAAQSNAQFRQMKCSMRSVGVFLTRHLSA
jgi:hypothetical protein